MKTEGNLTSCPQNRTRRGRIDTDFGRTLLPAARRPRSRLGKPPFVARAGKQDVRRQEGWGGHTDELAGASAVARLPSRSSASRG